MIGLFYGELLEAALEVEVPVLEVDTTTDAISKAGLATVPESKSPLGVRAERPDVGNKLLSNNLVGSGVLNIELIVVKTEITQLGYCGYSVGTIIRS